MTRDEQEHKENMKRPCAKCGGAVMYDSANDGYPCAGCGAPWNECDCSLAPKVAAQHEELLAKQRKLQSAADALRWIAQTATEAQAKAENHPA